MAIYKVKKIYKYTETVEVEADSNTEALTLAEGLEGERNYDDWLYDCEVVSTNNKE